MTKTFRRMHVLAIVLAIVTSACGASSEKDATPTTSRRTGIAAMVASYELVAGRPQRFIVGLLRDDQQKVVSFGSVQLAFAYLGTESRPTQTADVKFGAAATFMPIPGQQIDPATPGPRFADGSEGTGVYGVNDVTFDTAGFWGVQVMAKIDGRTLATQARFAVLDKNRIPAPGDPAPRTDNPIEGASGVNPRSIDSRAGTKTPIPDSTLHSSSIKAALDAGKPLVVVVSTPTYCTSRFCGPITDSIERLAQQHGDQIAFVHLEVWEDFEKKSLAPSAAEWIHRDGSDANEPWTFIVGRDGIIKQRFDNVATDAELQQAVNGLMSA